MANCIDNSNEDVAQIFNEIAKDLVDPAIYQEVKDQIQEHCGCHGLWPGPLANRSRPTKNYNWAGLIGLACEPNLKAETLYLPLPEKESLCSACHLSRLETLFSKCCWMNPHEENMHPSMNHANNITRDEQGLSESFIRETHPSKRKN